MSSASKHGPLTWAQGRGQTPEHSAGKRAPRLLLPVPGSSGHACAQNYQQTQMDQEGDQDPGGDPSCPGGVAAQGAVERDQWTVGGLRPADLSACPPTLPGLPQPGPVPSCTGALRAQEPLPSCFAVCHVPSLGSPKPVYNKV